ncbi:hypothetical protein [Denitromonas ohlonensis]|uniref:Uncharacterized protein n=2 Tax=Denitromonas TaxID=139331 RepID=A0A557RV63_9RHOO|nr:hypothetical protein [Denitromonas ohlonensis]TVO69046.1 hypothetical protein FHP90_00125 [Denitromonas ohlonensis]TVO77146.1 hypothetical protein FHP89_07355 [Denitromonas ohlonensis]
MSDNSTDEAIESLQGTAAYSDFLKFTVDTALSTSAVIDKVASWYMVGVGATLSLAISNSSNLEALIGGRALKHVLLYLFVAGLFGLLQKYCALRVAIRVAVNERMGGFQKRINKVLDEPGGVFRGMTDEEKSKVALLAIGKGIMMFVPWYQRWAVGSAMRKAALDPLMSHRVTSGFLNRQYFYGFSQLFFSGAAVLILAFHV